LIGYREPIRGNAYYLYRPRASSGYVYRARGTSGLRNQQHHRTHFQTIRLYQRHSRSYGAVTTRTGCTTAKMPVFTQKRSGKSSRIASAGTGSGRRPTKSAVDTVLPQIRIIAGSERTGAITALSLAQKKRMRYTATQRYIRRIRLTQSPQNREIVTFFRDVRPDTRIGTVAIMNWNDRRSGNRFPFNGVPGINTGDDTGQMGMIMGAEANSQTFFTVHLFMHNPQNTENVRRRFNALKEGITIKEP